MHASENRSRHRLVALAGLVAVIAFAASPTKARTPSIADTSPGTAIVPGMAVVAPALAPELVGATTIATPATVELQSPVGAVRVARSQAESWPVPATNPRRVVVVGDSLAEEAATQIQFLTAPREFVAKYWGGTAPCDWADDDLQADRSTVVVVTFTGNSLTPCMSDGAGGYLEREAFAVKYRQDLFDLVVRSRQAGAQVVLVGQPYRAPSFEHDDRVEAINAMLQEFASTWPFVSYVDAGAAVETPDGRFADRLPCTEFDVDCGPDGTTAVRGDGVHFCPVVGPQPCPVFSSGALRFALAIAHAANDPSVYD